MGDPNFVAEGGRAFLNGESKSKSKSKSKMESVVAEGRQEGRGHPEAIQSARGRREKKVQRFKRIRVLHLEGWTPNGMGITASAGG